MANIFAPGGYELAQKSDVNNIYGIAFPSVKTEKATSDFDLNSTFNGWRRAQNAYPKNAPSGINDSAFYLQMWTGNEDGTCIELAFGLAHESNEHDFNAVTQFFARSKGWGQWTKWYQFATTEQIDNLQRQIDQLTKNQNRGAN